MTLTVLLVIGVWVGVLAATNGGIPNTFVVHGLLVSFEGGPRLKNSVPHPMAGTVQAIQGSRVVATATGLDPI